MRISLLVPCYNEERNIRKAIESWLSQSRPVDEIIVVDDSSTDATAGILREYKDRITVIRTPKNLGNKSYAQEFGLKFVTGDILVTTDGDTVLDKEFMHRMQMDFTDPSVAAVGGYVKSIKYNMLTACRALDYAIGQNIDKVAQDYLDFIFVIPGAAGAFRTEVFRRVIRFDHDTLTEDLDFTYKLHLGKYKIKYDRLAICYTQDPSDLRSYVNQMRRWYAGGWQNLRKHICVPDKPGMSLELSLMYVEGFVFSILIFVLPFINPALMFLMFSVYSGVILCLATYGALREGRWDVLLATPWYILLRYVHAYIYLEQFVSEILLKKRSMVWQRSLRVNL